MPEPLSVIHSLCYKLFATATYMTTERRKFILNLAVATQPRAWEDDPLDNSKQLNRFT